MRYNIIKYIKPVDSLLSGQKNQNPGRVALIVGLDIGYYA